MIKIVVEPQALDEDGARLDKFQSWVMDAIEKSKVGSGQPVLRVLGEDDQVLLSLKMTGYELRSDSTGLIITDKR